MKTASATTLVWLQRELRLSHLPALQQALSDSQRVLLVYFHDPQQQVGSANSTWLAHSLAKLQQQVSEKGGSLWVIQGELSDTLSRLIEHYAVQAVYYSHQVGEPFASSQEVALQVCQKAQVELRPFFSEYWFDPGVILNKQDSPYVVFTPFYKALMARIDLLSPFEESLGDLSKTAVQPLERSWLDLPENLKTQIEQAWSKKVMSHWQVGEAAAWHRLDAFVDESLSSYDEQRDFPAVHATSALSPHLHFGEISSRAIYFELLARMESSELDAQAVYPWIRQLAWREFARLLLWFFPETESQPFQAKFAKMPWHSENETTQAWSQGKTGIPIIDAGMRELWETGTMHNRVRMLVASFLTKNLNQHWLVGKRWFDDTLVDADPANNVMGWQWVAGCGVDAAPYYRLFNPLTQSLKFDAEGTYLRRWLPELSLLSNKAIHAPWQHIEECRLIGIQLGKTYPEPLVDLAQSRQSHLERVAFIKNA
ncbi:cryptochrome/photolyase family protein [Thiomicrorhabdus chilensis]|uniref:cryptochrome/photolyase family protein n=1 Tax=Thiomicrorhabdus chilensis TaxID=63656 RepID=UPI00042A1278|nr:deoxyribodipyrimidine photo-lyase [Thiomicrorhabdus chilensis]